MKLTPLLLVSLLGLTTATTEEQLNNLGAFQSDWPVGDSRRCLEQSRLSKMPVKRFEVLPGLGWDNLRNLEQGMVVSYNFTQCRVTDDGNFLIPDNIFTVPIKSSSVERFAEMIDQWHNVSSLTSNSVNMEAGLSLTKGSVSGKFSYEHSELKSKQIEDKAVTVRVQMRYLRYEAKLQPDPVLSPQFRSRLLSIAARIELNQTEQARYEGQLLVRDFGTHVLTSVTAGAGLVKDDFVKSDFISAHSEKKSDILASASASFLNIFHFGSSIRPWGGPMYQAEGMAVDDWTKAVDKNLVPMDRSGDPLYFLVTQHTLPELPLTTVSELEKIVRESIELYYEMNTIRGCTKLGAPNFSFSANFDDGSCNARPTNVTFGGVFQTCEVSGQFLTKNPCDGLNQVNPKTSGYSCPASYTAVRLHSAVKTGSSESRRSCHSCWLFFECCHTDEFQAKALYSTYWCAATHGNVPDAAGYLFGGLYTSTQENLVTNTFGCPPRFYARHMFFDMSICISEDFELASPMSVPFGGFFSCEVGNPLSLPGVRPVGSKLKAAAPPTNSLQAFMQANDVASSYPVRCPEGYSQHLATIDVGCAINYCVLTGALSGPALPPVKRPPFMSKPLIPLEDPNNLVMFNMETQTWIKNEKAVKLQQSLQYAVTDSPSKSSDKSGRGGMANGTVAGISVGVTLACVLVSTLIFVAVKKRRSRKNETYRRLTSETTYGSVAEGPDSVLVNES
ncbi:macrophage-expressed gene 1 protein-like [Physella acuta]|uniref:macrophage-expressed gene 1 protein-like n=1 Tax=Physella acuta TaxID=109671 RepID=UPI0027DE8EFC|nr:macrophage-expressed gene 1 protein-like [Physella acuta]